MATYDIEDLGFDNDTPPTLGSQRNSRTFSLSLKDTGGDAIAPVIGSVSPASGSEIGRNDPITFEVSDNVGVVIAAIWIKYTKTNYRVLVYDGSAFSPPFDTHSTVTDPGGDTKLLQFSIRPLGGWWDTIEELTVRAADGNLDVV